MYNEVLEFEVVLHVILRSKQFQARKKKTELAKPRGDRKNSTQQAFIPQTSWSKESGATQHGKGDTVGHGDPVRTRNVGILTKNLIFCRSAPQLHVV